MSLEEAIGLVQSIRRDCRNQLVANHVVIELLTVNIFRAAFDDILFGNDLDVDNFGLSIREDSTIDDNLHFMSLLLCENSVSLTSFLKYRSRIIKGIADERFEQAESNLKSMELELGQSLWSVSTLLSVYYMQNKDENVLKFRNAIPKDLPKSSSSTILYECLKSRSTATYESYHQSLNRQLEDLRLYGFSELDDYVRFISSFDPKDNYKDLRYIIANCSLKRLPDLYTNFVRIVRYCFVHKISIGKTLVPLTRLSELPGCEELKILVGKLNAETSSSYCSESDLKAATDLYLKGQYDATIEKISEVLTEKPDLSYLYEIVSKCPNILEKLALFPPFIQKIIVLYVNLNKKENLDSSLKELKEIFLNLKQFDWAYHLKSQIEKFSFTNREGLAVCYNFADLTQIQFPPFDLISIRAMHSHSVIKLIEKNFYSYDAIRAFLNVSTGFSNGHSSVIPNWRALKGRAEYAFYSGDFNTSLENYERLRATNNRQVCKQEISARIVDSYFQNCQEKESIKELASSLLNGYEPSLFPIKLVAEYIISKVKRNTERDLLESCAIVLHFYNNKYQNIDITQEISNIIENLFGILGIKNKDELLPDSWPLSHFILTHVVTIDVLDGLILFFENDLDIYTAKLAICSNYIKNLDRYEAEIDKRHVLNDYSSTFNRFVLYVCSSDMNEGRIKVEKEAIKSILIDKYTISFQNLEREVATEDIKFVEIDHEFGNATVSGTETVNYLADLLLSIFREYTVNKLHGIDNCLNLRFRHGEIRNILWSSLRKQKLSGKKISERKFDVEEVFVDYQLFNEDSLKNAKSALNEFLINFDSDILAFRESCNADSIDFLTEESRFFNYSLDSVDVKEFIRHFSEGDTLGALIDSAFSLIDNQTNNILTEIKKFGLPKLLSTLETRFDKLIAETHATPVAFQKNVNLAKSSTREKVAEMANWFDWSEEPSTSFNFGAVFEKSSQLIESLYPSLNIEKVFEDDTLMLVQPNMFTSFVTILTLALENAARHSGLPAGFKLSVTVYEKDFLTIEVVNTMSIEAQERAANNVALTNADIESNAVSKAAKVSGSGTYKIKTLLSNRLNLRNKIELKAEEQEFSLKIVILDKHKVAYEGSDS